MQTRHRQPRPTASAPASWERSPQRAPRPTGSSGRALGEGGVVPTRDEARCVRTSVTRKAGKAGRTGHPYCKDFARGGSAPRRPVRPAGGSTVHDTRGATQNLERSRRLEAREGLRTAGKEPSVAGGFRRNQSSRSSVSPTIGAVRRVPAQSAAPPALSDRPYRSCKVGHARLNDKTATAPEKKMSTSTASRRPEIARPSIHKTARDASSQAPASGTSSRPGASNPSDSRARFAGHATDSRPLEPKTKKGAGGAGRGGAPDSRRRGAPAAPGRGGHAGKGGGAKR